MAHKMLENGTAYEITGGKVMDEGTVYEIDHGKALDEGTVYDVLFGEKYSGVVSVTVSGGGSSSACFVSFGASNNYSSAVSTSTYTGNTIELFVAGFASWIKIDGTAVSHTAGQRYPWTVPTGVRKISIILSTATIGGSTHGFITVLTS